MLQASEHTAQRQMDTETIRRLENVRDELVRRGEGTGATSDRCMQSRVRVSTRLCVVAPWPLADYATPPSGRTREVEGLGENKASCGSHRGNRLIRTTRW